MLLVSTRERSTPRTKQNASSPLWVDADVSLRSKGQEKARFLEDAGALQSTSELSAER